MPRRGFQESAPQGGMAQFTAGAPPAAPPTVATDYSGIQQALSGFTAISMQRDARQAEADAAVAQEIAGVSGVAQPEGFMLPSAARAFEQRAQAVYSQQLQTEATATAAELLRNHLFDPEGFEQAWNAYTEGKLKSLQDDPVFAANVGLALNDMGVRQRTQIETNVFERTQEGISVEMTAAFQSQIDATQDQILTYPNQAFVVEQIALFDEQITAMDETGIFAPRQIEAFRAQLNDTLYGAYIEGKIREATEASDMATLQTLHYNLQRGMYFDNNEIGFRFANRIASSMGGDVSTGEINARFDVAETVSNRLGRGLSLTEEERIELAAAAVFIQDYGNDDQKRRFQQLTDGIAIKEAILPVIQNGGLRELEMLAAQLDQDFALELMSPEVVNELVGQVRNRKAELRDLIEDADLAATGPSNVVSVNIVDLLHASSEVQAAFFNDLGLNTVAVSAENGADPKTTFPWTANHIAQFGTLMSNAFNREDMQLFGNLQRLYLRGFGADENGLGGDINLAARAMHRTSSGVAGSILLSSVIEDPQESAQMTNFIMSGTQIFSGDPNNATYQNLMELRNNFTSQVYSLAQGDATLFDAISRSVGHAMIGAQVAGLGSNEASSFIQNAFGTFDMRALANDQEIAARLVHPEEEVANALVELADNFLSDNRPELGGMYDYLIPVPYKGVIRFRDSRSGYFLRDNQNMLVEISLPDERLDALLEQADQTRAAANIELAEAQEQQRLMMENRLDIAQGEKRHLLHFGEKAGLSEDEAFNYYRAVSHAPASSMLNLPNGISTAITPQLMQEDPSRPVAPGQTPEATAAIGFARGAIGEVSPDVRFQPTQTDVLRGATVYLYAELLEQFNRDQKKALAAMVSSPQDVEMAVQMFGDNWLDAVDLPVQTFVYRGLGFEEEQ